MKTEMTSVDISAALREIKKYRGGRLGKTYQYPGNVYRLKLSHHDEPNTNLLIQIDEDIKRIHLRSDFEDAPTQPPELPMLIRNKMGNGEVVQIGQIGFDRIVRLGVENEQRHSIVAEFFGDGNLAVLDHNDKVLRCVNTLRLKSRMVAPGEIYTAPQGRQNPIGLELNDLKEIIQGSDTDLVRTLASQLNIGGLYAEEICLRSDIEKETPTDELRESDIEDVHGAIQGVIEDLTEQTLKPYIIRRDEEPFDVVPINLEVYSDEDKEKFSSFNEAVDTYFEEIEREKSDEEDEEGRADEIKRIIRHQKSAIKDFRDEEEEIKKSAEALYRNYGDVQEVLNVIREARKNGYSNDEIHAELTEAREEGRPGASIYRDIEDGYVILEVERYKVSLDPGESIEVNADRLYTEAKNVAEKIEGAREAIEDKKEELKRINERDEEHEKEKRGDRKRTSPRGEEWYHRFRWFRTTDDFLVIAGRDADQNEEIYSKYMEKHDYFFHTEAKGAPFTVLKTLDPQESYRDVEVPRDSLEQAAVFAASYSNLWREGHHSGDVYMVKPDQLSKTPESGEYIEKGSVVVRGERTYFRGVLLGVSVGLRLDSEAGVIGGPGVAVKPLVDAWVDLEPGVMNRNDVAQRIYRFFREEIGDDALVREIGNVEEIMRFLPPGGSHIID